MWSFNIPDVFLWVETGDIMLMNEYCLQGLSFRITLTENMKVNLQFLIFVTFEGQ